MMSSQKRLAPKLKRRRTPYPTRYQQVLLKRPRVDFLVSHLGGIIIRATKLKRSLVLVTTNKSLSSIIRIKKNKLSRLNRKTFFHRHQDLLMISLNKTNPCLDPQVTTNNRRRGSNAATICTSPRLDFFENLCRFELSFCYNFREKKSG